MKIRKIFYIGFLLLPLALGGCVRGEAYGLNLYGTADTGKTLKEREEALENIIMEIDGVDFASVYISGQTALIGIDVNPGYDPETVKDAARRAAAEADTGISFFAVTSDGNINERIKNLD